MNKNFVICIFILVTLLLCLVPLQTVNSSSSQKIFIKPDGSVNPSTAPLRQVGNVYTFTGQVNSQIVVECNNIVIDGSGYSLKGGGSGVAFNMTCSNVTVQNTRINHWNAGVLGVFNNNTVKDCLIAHCDSAFKLYAQQYVIIGNTIENNNEGIRVGQGGMHFIAGNNITNNAIGLYLFDDGNVIVQNNIADCSNSAIILDTTAWTQTVYHNNFVNNSKEIIDYTYGNTPDRPLQSTVQPWDNGSSGNFWSDYNGTDRNGDSIGDAQYEIPTYYRGTALAPNGFVDQYPLMAPENANGPIPPIPASLIPLIQSIPKPDDQPKALSFLQDVLGVDLDKYDVTLMSGSGTEDLEYSLYNSTSTSYAHARMQFSNGTLTWCNLYLTYGQLLLTQPFFNTYDTAEKIIHNYQAWTNDSDVNKMASLLDAVGSERNTTEKSGNIDLTILSKGYSAYSWSYTYNGADYTGVQLTIFHHSHGVDTLMFSDNRAEYNIGNTDINITKQQAIAIAADYVRNDFSYPLNFANGTTTFVKDLMVSDENTTASLATARRDAVTMYPYWNVKVALDHTYPGHTIAVNVQVWADTGTVFQAKSEVDGSFLPFISSLFTDIALAPLIVTIITIVLSLLVIVVILVILLLKERNNNPPKAGHTRSALGEKK